MKEAANVIVAIGRATGNDKLYLLKHYENAEGLKEILRFIYNPYCKTGISEAKLNKGFAMVRHSPYRDISYRDAIQYFKAHQTGSDADAAYAAQFVNYTSETLGDDAMRLACAIVTQNLKIGVSVTSLNKVYGADFIPKVGCMLGTLYDDVNPASVHWPCIVTEKLDGVRRVLIKDNGMVAMFSRSGHIDEGLVEILEEAKHLPDNFVYDGELLAIGDFRDNIEQRQATASLANAKGRKTGLSFNVFDMVPVDEFYAGVSKDSARIRKIRLGATLMDDSIQVLDEDWQMRIAAFGIYTDLKFIRSVPVLGLVNNINEVEPIVEYIWEHGGEGVMLNTAISPYEIKRSKQLLKIKHTEEHILPVVNMIEGTGKYEDSMGALVVLYTAKDGSQSYLGVGSGFTDAQRDFIWTHKDAFIGRKIEVECFGESTNAQGYKSLNCPIFLRFVGDEHE